MIFFLHLKPICINCSSKKVQLQLPETEILLVKFYNIYSTISVIDWPLENLNLKMNKTTNAAMNIFNS